jgi:hypothetical protein
MGEVCRCRICPICEERVCACEKVDVPTRCPRCGYLLVNIKEDKKDD